MGYTVSRMGLLALYTTLVVPVACGGKVREAGQGVEGDDTGDLQGEQSAGSGDVTGESVSDGSEAANSSTSDDQMLADATPIPPTDGPAIRCGTSPGDEGSATEPIEISFEQLWDAGYLGSVGTGASCYRLVDLEPDGGQFFVRDPERDGTISNERIYVDCFAYFEEGFGSDPYYENTGLIGSVYCNSYPSSGAEQLEVGTRYLVIDGSRTTAGGQYLLTAEP